MSDNLPFVAVEDDVALALRLAAERATLSGADYAELLARLIRTCREQGFRVGQTVRVIEMKTPAQPSHIVPLKTVDQAREAHAQRANKSAAPPPPKLSEQEKLLRRLQGRSAVDLHRISEDDRRNLYRRYKLARGAGDRAPYGWIKNAAAEYRVTTSTIHNVIAEEKEREQHHEDENGVGGDVRGGAGGGGHGAGDVRP